MKKLAVLFTLPILMALGCTNKSSVDLSGYAPEVKTAIQDFVKEYKNKEDAYIVSDFDNTTVIFDEVKENDQEYAKIHIDGIVNSDIFRKISPLSYKIPEIIASNMKFNGVPVEYVMAEKIMAITNELKRPYKHLVDVYSLISLNINVELLKNYLHLIVENDNKVRAKLNKEIRPYIYQIKDNKEFVGSYIFTTLQAGYNIPLQEMIEIVNQWLIRLS